MAAGRCGDVGQPRNHASRPHLAARSGAVDGSDDHLCGRCRRCGGAAPASVGAAGFVQRRMTQPPRSTLMIRMQWTAVILCAAAIAINYLDRSTIAVANPEIRAEFHLSAAQFGALQSAWSLAFAVAQIPVGLFVDRLGPGLLLGISLILWSLAVAAGGLVATYTRLLVARAALGITESPAYPSAVRVTSNWFQVRDRGTPTGVFNMGANIGTAIAPPLLTALMLLAGWRSMFIAMGIVGIAASVVWFWLYRDPAKVVLASTDVAYLAANKSGRAVLPSRPANGAGYSAFVLLGPWCLAHSVQGTGYGCMSPGFPGILRESNTSASPGLAMWRPFLSCARLSARSAEDMRPIVLSCAECP